MYRFFLEILHGYFKCSIFYSRIWGTERLVEIYFERNFPGSIPVPCKFMRAIENIYSFKLLHQSKSIFRMLAIGRRALCRNKLLIPFCISEPFASSGPWKHAAFLKINEPRLENMRKRDALVTLLKKRNQELMRLKGGSSSSLFFTTEFRADIEKNICLLECKLFGATRPTEGDRNYRMFT